MIDSVIAALLLAAQPGVPVTPPARGPTDWCRGIHMPNGEGGVNLLWTTFRGNPENLRVIRGRLDELGAWFSDDDSGGSEMRAYYRDDLDVRSIASLLNAVDRGEFGTVTTEDYAMPLNTLPADRCIRFAPN